MDELFYSQFREALRTIGNNGQNLSTKYEVTESFTTNNHHALFVDATFYDEIVSYATGFVIYDPGGNMVAAGFQQISPPGSVMAAELHAIANGNDFASEFCEGPWKIFTDSLDVVHALRSGSIFKGMEEDILQRARDQICNSQVVGVWYCRRSLNKEAHKLAKMTTKMPQAWLGDDIPRHLVSKAPTL